MLERVLHERARLLVLQARHEERRRREAPLAKRIAQRLERRDVGGEQRGAIENDGYHGMIRREACAQRLERQHALPWQIERRARHRLRRGHVELGPGMAGKPAQQAAQIVGTALAEIGQQRIQVRVSERRSFEQPRIVAVLARQHGKHNARLARERRQRLDAVAPPVEPAEQPHDDDLGVARHRVRPQIDGHGMAQVTQMREPQARQHSTFRGIGDGETGKVAVGERQDHEVARALAEIDRLDDVVEARGACLQQVHRVYPPSDFAIASRSRPFRPMTTRLPCRASPAPHGRS